MNGDGKRGGIAGLPPGRWQRFLRTAERVRAEAGRSRVFQMAAALSYRTIFALIPIIAVAMVVVKAFVNKTQMSEALAKGLEYAGLTQIVLEKDQVGASSIEDGSGQALTGSIRLDEWITKFVEKTQDVPFTAVGIIAVVMLIYAAISMLVEVERAFNEVYKAPTGRSWPRRITLYWTLLTLGSIGLFASFYLGEMFRSWALSIADMGAQLTGVTIPAKSIGFMVTALISTLMFLLAYTTVPSARVRLMPALGGAVVGAVLWEAGKWGFTQYLHYSASYAKLYGALALVPLFLLWIYLTWVVVLVGLQMAFVMQYGLASDENHGIARVVDPTAGVAIMAGVARGFSDGRAVDAPTLARWAGVTLDVADDLLDALTRRGLLHTVRKQEGGPVGYALARPADQISVRDALEASLSAVGTVEGSAELGAGIDIGRRLREAQLAAAGNDSLASLVRAEGKPRGRTGTATTGGTGLLPVAEGAGWSAPEAAARLDPGGSDPSGAVHDGEGTSAASGQERPAGRDDVADGDDDLRRLLREGGGREGSGR